MHFKSVVQEMLYAWVQKAKTHKNKQKSEIKVNKNGYGFLESYMTVIILLLNIGIYSNTDK